MKSRTRGLRALAILASVAALGFSTFALADPPSRVARLGYTTGTVSFSPGGESDWVRATINRPLGTGDRLWAEAGGRAEIQVGGAMIRMNAGTGVSVINLDDRIAQLQLTQGVLNVRIRRLEQDQVFEIDTPNLAFTIRQPGEYRIEVDPEGDATTIYVRQGRGEVYGEGASYVIDSRQPVSIHGDEPPRLPVCRPAPCRRIRSLVGRTGPPLRHVGLCSLRVAGRGRLSGSRCQRHLARRRGLRQRLVPESGGDRLGAVPRRALGVGGSVGLDLDRRCALGLRRFPLRPLDEHSRRMGLGTRSRSDPRLLRTGTGRVRGRRQLPAVDFQRQRRRRRVVPARAARGVPAVLCGEPRLLRERQSQQHDRQHDRHQQLLQQHQREQRGVRQPASAGSRHRRPDHRVRTVATGGEVGGPRPGGFHRPRAGRSRPGDRTDRAQRARRGRSGRRAACSRVRAARRRPLRAAGRTRRFRSATAATRGQARPAARRRHAPAAETDRSRACTGRPGGRAGAEGTPDDGPAGDAGRHQAVRCPRQARTACHRATAWTSCSTTAASSASSGTGPRCAAAIHARNPVCAAFGSARQARTACPRATARTSRSSPPPPAQREAEARPVPRQAAPPAPASAAPSQRPEQPQAAPTPRAAPAAPAARQPEQRARPEPAPTARQVEPRPAAAQPSAGPPQAQPATKPEPRGQASKPAAGKPDEKGKPDERGKDGDEPKQGEEGRKPKK